MTTENHGAVPSENSTQPARVTPQGYSPQDNALEHVQQTTEPTPDVQVKVGQRAPRRQFSTTYKLKILEEYDACANTLARGALLRKEGLYHSRLSTWRKQRDIGNLSIKAKVKTQKSVLRNQQLTRENVQLKKKLMQAEAIIDLQKKVSELLGTHILPAESNEFN